MPMLTTLRMRLPVWPVHCPLRTRSEKSAILRSTSCTAGTTFSPSTSIDRTFGGAQRDVQDGAVLGDVDLLAPEHGVDAVAEAGPLRERDEEAEGLVGDAVLGVVEVDAVDLDGQALAAVGIVGEQVAEVDVAQLVEVRVERAPLRRLGDRAAWAAEPTAECAAATRERRE